MMNMMGKLLARVKVGTASTATNWGSPTRQLATAPHNQVLVSQSSDLLSNAALEAWVMDNIDLERKSILILSNNARNNKKTLKASFLGEAVECPPQLVIQSLPARLLLESIPVVSLMQNGSIKNLIVNLQVKGSVEERSLMEAMEFIGTNFLTSGRTLDSLSRDEPWMRLSLVRPDDGWFPGIGRIRKELELALKESEEIAKDKKRWLLRRRLPHYRLLTSFGF